MGNENLKISFLVSYEKKISPKVSIKLMRPYESTLSLRPSENNSALRENAFL